MSDKRLPEVAGRRCSCSINELEQRLKACISEEQETLNPDNMLIAALCDAIRQGREYGDIINSRAKPTPAGVTVKRTLNSMVEDEINELLAMLFPTGTRERSIDFRDQDGQQGYQITLSDQDYHTWYVTIGMGYFSAICADDDIGGSIHPAKLIKWFIEKGFDVFRGIE